MIVLLRFGLILSSLAMVSSPCAAETNVVEEQLALPVTIDGHAKQLETLIVHPATDSRFPIALIVNGSAVGGRLGAGGLAHLAHDFAHRGWLAASVIWRGYGTSSGVIQSEAGTCTDPDVARFLDAHADDLAAALAALRTRPDVDPTVTLGLGVSIGGVSMLDLAARPDHPLRAVINLSGGLYHDAKPFIPDPACAPFEADLVRNLSSFGTARVPTLWLYAANDPWFRPALVERMLKAYRASGGNADLTMFPPFGAGGHTLYKWEANDLTQPKIDEFLRRHRLPAMDEDDALAPLLATLGPDDRDLVQQYLRAPTEKALAIPPAGTGAFWQFAAPSIDAARHLALAHCHEATAKECHLLAENRHLVEGWREGLASAAN